MTTISQKDPVPEAVKNMIPPDQSGVVYVAKRYIVEALASGNANAFAFAVQNPEAVDCIVTNVIVDITTSGGTASSVLDVDVAADATSTGDSIIDGLDLNATGVADRHDDAGTNGGEALKWDKNGGANDYVTKPFSPRELLVRVKAVLRRTQASPEAKDVYQFDDIKIDFKKYQAFRKKKEFSSHEISVLTMVKAK